MMKKKIFNTILISIIAFIIALTGVVTASSYLNYSRTQINELKNETSLVVRAIENEGESYLESFNDENLRITWVNSDGTIKYDSKADKNELGNHMDREEIKEAYETGYGEAIRKSDTILKQVFYVAIKLNDGSIIRLSSIKESLFMYIINTLYPLYIASIVMILLSILIAYFSAKKMVEPLNKIDLDDPLKTNKYKELEPMLKRIDTQTKELKRDKENIEKTSLIRQEFTANVSHELKTPLHVISGYAELIQNGLTNAEDTKEFAFRINKEALRMSSLVENIMELSTLETVDNSREKKTVRLDLIVKNVINELKIKADEKNITINLDLPESELYGLEDVLHSIVYNLVDNAIKYNKDNGYINIKINNYMIGRPVFIIEDSGIGIKKEDQERIFERFYRVDKSHSKEIGGTGLGLSIVKHGVLLHAAKITVNSEVDKGSTFRIYF